MATYTVDERETKIYKTTLKDETGVAIQQSQLTTLTLTLYDASTGTIVNSRNAQNVLNANNCTYHTSSGLLTWTVQPADLAILDNMHQYEHRVALFEWTWGSGTKHGKHRVHLIVENLEKVA